MPMYGNIHRDALYIPHHRERSSSLTVNAEEDSRPPLPSSGQPRWNDDRMKNPHKAKSPLAGIVELKSGRLG